MKKNRVTIIGSDDLERALQSISLKLDDCIKAACEAEARRIHDDMKRHLEQLSFMYHQSKALDKV